MIFDLVVTFSDGNLRVPRCCLNLNSVPVKPRNSPAAVLRVLNTNIDGRVKVMFALTSIKGIGRRFSYIICKKAEIDLNKRAGELSAVRQPHFECLFVCVFRSVAVV